MNPNESPFEILGISRDAELEVVNAAYRALARKYHPDTNPGVPSDELNRRMVRINWAKAELERDLQGWRRREKAQEESRSDDRAGRARTGSRWEQTASSRAKGTHHETSRRDSTQSGSARTDRTRGRAPKGRRRDT